MHNTIIYKQILKDGLRKLKIFLKKNINEK